MGKSRLRKDENHTEKKLAEENEGLFQVLFCFGGRITKRDMKMTRKDVENLKAFLEHNTPDQMANSSVAGAGIFWLVRRLSEGVLRELMEAWQKDHGFPLKLQSPQEFTEQVVQQVVQNYMNDQGRPAIGFGGSEVVTNKDDSNEAPDKSE